mgnify:CR=1 FL=1
MGREYELKFTVTKDTLEDIKSAFDGFSVYNMQTSYYDTCDYLIANGNGTLRKRIENDQCIFTLKLPEGKSSRLEFETSSETLSEAISVFAAMGAPNWIHKVSEQSLICVCSAKFVRMAKRIQENDTEFELALDEGILSAGDRECSFQEVELELKTGEETVVNQFADDLAERFSLKPENRSKYQRALSLSRM